MIAGLVVRGGVLYGEPSAVVVAGDHQERVGVTGDERPRDADSGLERVIFCVHGDEARRAFESELSS